MKTLTDRLADALVAEHTAIMERNRIARGTDRYVAAEAEVDRLADETDALFDLMDTDEIDEAHDIAAERCECCRHVAAMKSMISNYASK